MALPRDDYFVVQSIYVATDNWTDIPANWEVLRRSWEYSHAVGAMFQVLAMSSLIIAALARGKRRA